MGGSTVTHRIMPLGVRRRLFKEVKLIFGYPKEIICMNKPRLKNMSRARKYFAKRAREEGYSYMEIGRVMNKDHSTIRYYCGVRQH